MMTMPISLTICSHRRHGEHVKEFQNPIIDALLLRFANPIFQEKIIPTFIDIIYEFYE